MAAVRPTRKRPRFLSKHYGNIGGYVFRYDAVIAADFTKLPELLATVTLSTGKVLIAQGIDALELAYALKPSVVEGRKLYHRKVMWALHNLVGHPLMFILAICGLQRLAFWVHDQTIPKVRPRA